MQPCGKNRFGIQFERVLPAASTANLYPFNYSGKADPEGFEFRFIRFTLVAFANIFFSSTEETALV